MSKHGQRYAPEFKKETVALMRQGDRTIRQIAEDLGIVHQTFEVTPFSWTVGS